MSPAPDPETASERPTVIVADPDPLARRAISSILQDDRAFVVAAQPATGTEATELAIHYAPDVLLVESVFPDRDGIEVTRNVLERRPEVRVILVTASPSEELAFGALRAGASGVLDKHLADDALRAAVRSVASGQAAIPPQMTMRLVERVRNLPEPGHGFRPIRSELTNREWEVLDLLMAQASTSEIAEALVLTEDTIYSHIKSVMRKFGVHSRAAAISVARERWEEPVAA
jgi:NarL family two-component system response regulator LiaR